MNELARISQDVAESLVSYSEAPLARAPVLDDLSWMIQRNRQGEELVAAWQVVANKRNQRISDLECKLKAAQHALKVHGLQIKSLCTQSANIRAVLDKAGCAEIGGDVETRTSRRVEQLAKERNAAAEIISEAHRKLDAIGAGRASTLSKRLTAWSL